jgi:hypothetical protein
MLSINYVIKTLFKNYVIKGMYNDAILAMPHRINANVEERES